MAPLKEGSTCAERMCCLSQLGVLKTSSFSCFFVCYVTAEWRRAGTCKHLQYSRLKITSELIPKRESKKTKITQLVISIFSIGTPRNAHCFFLRLCINFAFHKRHQTYLGCEGLKQSVFGLKGFGHHKFSVKARPFVTVKPSWFLFSTAKAALIHPSAPLCSQSIYSEYKLHCVYPV